MSPQSLQTVRAAALLTLVRAEKGGKYLNLELDAAQRRFNFHDADRALFAALVYGVCERAITLDFEISHLTSRAADTLDAETRTALRLGLYQLLYMDKIPPHAAVNETVSACPARSRPLVNAALRRSLREGACLHIPEGLTKAERLSAEHSLPLPLVRSWLADYGEETPALCAATHRRPSVTLRVNTLKTDTERLLSVIPGAHRNGLFPDMIDLPASGAVTELPGFDEGLWFVEDAASRLAVAAASPRRGDTVVDVCSAPGGKSFSAAIDMENEGKIYSFDLHENKLGLIRRGAERIGIDIIRASARDGREPDPALFGSADVVLCDVPCSGLGVIAKKPDIRYKDLSAANALPEVQLAILSASASYVKPGGVLLYSTCTLRRAENEDVVSSFLSRFGQFRPEPFSVSGIDAKDGTLTLMPHKNSTDGFFVAKLRKA